MTEYINKFTNYDRGQFKRNAKRLRTVCRVFVRVTLKQGNKPQKKEFKDESTSSNKGHAEFLALLNITKDLMKYLHQTDKAKITEIDLVIRLNNSPCHDCQSFIKYWIQHVIRGLIPQVDFRFILHFSNFYTEIDTFKNWALALANLGITLFFCPIIVSQILPCGSVKKVVNRIKNSDIKLMTNFTTLFTEFPNLHISCSEELKKQTDLETYVSKPQYICISPSDITPDLPYPIKSKKQKKIEKKEEKERTKANKKSTKESSKQPEKDAQRNLL